MSGLREALKSAVPRGLRESSYPARERFRRALANALARLRLRAALRSGLPLASLNRYEQRVYSQNGEDGLLAALFAAVGTTNRYAVEFGVEDGATCNTRLLRERGWDGLQMDCGDAPPPGIRREFVTAENVNGLFRKYGVPPEPDLLSIDVDGNDYWIWKAIEGYRPRVVVIEYNAELGPDASRAVRYDPRFRWDGSDYSGASLAALVKLGREKGYRLAACDLKGVNAFFVREDLAGRFALPDDHRALYRPLHAEHGRRRRSDKPWVEV